MAKLEGVKTIVVGGKKDVPQHYCGIVGGQSTDFETIDTEIKVTLFDCDESDNFCSPYTTQSTGLKDHELAPPDL